MIVSKHFILLTLVLAPVIGEIFITEEDKIRGMDRNCPTVRHHVAKYHQDTACDRAAQNQYKPTLDRADVRVRLQHTGTRNVPDVKTSFCPQEAHPLVTPDHTTGFDTAWIVENTATTPVVISYVMQQEDGSFTEVSPFDTKSLAPTNQDPRNFLKPGEWKRHEKYPQTR